MSPSNPNYAPVKPALMSLHEAARFVPYLCDEAGFGRQSYQTSPTAAADQPAPRRTSDNQAFSG